MMMASHSHLATTYASKAFVSRPCMGARCSSASLSGWKSLSTGTSKKEATRPMMVSP